MATQAEREAEFRAAFSVVLRQLRSERQLTQEQLAEASGCHVNHVSFLERGLRIPSLLVVFQLAAGLGVSPAELVAGIDAALRGDLSLSQSQREERP